MKHGRCLAMWSGPRNLSTAMMRAWGNRSDTVVVDEPLYAHYLQATGIAHPMAEQIIANGETDWQTVIGALASTPDSGIFYQKHITTHWMPYFNTDWLAKLDHVFLIRDPVRVVASYTAKREHTKAEDLGYEQQFRLFECIAELQGKAPLVIDSALFLVNPEFQLRSLCTSLSLDFQKTMLEWPAGGRETDGIWEAHWYDSVKRSTGFAVAQSSTPEQTSASMLDSMTADQKSLVADCLPHYERLLALAIKNKS